MQRQRLGAPAPVTALATGPVQAASIEGREASGQATPAVRFVAERWPPQKQQHDRRKPKRSAIPAYREGEK